jgi:hypothetical protein
VTNLRVELSRMLGEERQVPSLACDPSEERKPGVGSVGVRSQSPEP